MAQTAKEKGNAAFKSGDYPTAIGHYTSAILADRNDYTFPLNRAAAYLKLGKNEDAERDCNAVLALNAFNAKALFRRGQARAGMGKLDEARQDFVEALKREPANGAVKEELTKVVNQLSKQELKPRPVSVSPKRRRVPIKIVYPDATASLEAVPYASKPTAELPGLASENDTLKPISSRSLKPPPAAGFSTAPSPPTSTPVVSPTPEPEQTQTFKDAKNARDRIGPSRVGGGIFLASGDSRIFPTRSTVAEPKSVPGSGDGSSRTSSFRNKALAPDRPLTSWFDFSRAWDSLSTTEERWSLFSAVPPSALPTFFKASLEPTMLVSILEMFREVVRAAERKSAVREYLEYFARVPRFETLVLFLSRGEKVVARGVLESVGASKGELGRQWGAVW